MNSLLISTTYFYKDAFKSKIFLGTYSCFPCSPTLKYDHKIELKSSQLSQDPCGTAPGNTINHGKKANF